MRGTEQAPCSCCAARSLFCLALIKKMRISGFAQNQTATQRQRLRFGEEEQQNERAPMFEKSRSKRYDACSGVSRHYEITIYLKALRRNGLDGLACHFCVLNKKRLHIRCILGKKAAYTEDTTARQPSDRRDHCAGMFQRKEARFPAIQGFPFPCQSRNGVGGGYWIPRASSDTRQFPRPHC